MRAVSALLLPLFLQVPAGSAAADVLLQDPPEPSWIEIIDLVLDSESAAELGIGEVEDFDEVDSHLRAWTSPDGDVLVAVAVALPTRQAVAGFLEGATASALQRGERLEPYPDLPLVDRYAVVDEGVLVEAAVFAVGRYGFSVQGTGADAADLVADQVRLQIARAPTEPAPDESDSAYELGRAVGRLLIPLVLIGLGIWVYVRFVRKPKGPMADEAGGEPE